MFKKTIALLGSVVSGFTFAGTMGPVCTPGNVTVPCEFRQWDIGVQALYLQPTFSGTKGFVQGGTSSPRSQITRVRNDWDWGYRLEGSYHFNTGNDATVTWTHFSGDVIQSGLQNFVLILSAPDQPMTLQGRNRFDQVNLVLGQTADFSAVKTMRFYGGLQVAHLQFNDLASFAILPAQFFPAGTPLVITQNETYDYKALGPVMGIDYAYALTDAFSVTANGAGSILIGRSSFNNRFLAADLGVVLAGVGGNQTLIVPSLEAKVGLNYAYRMAQGVLNLQAGYEILDYYNALLTRGFRQLSLAASTDIERSSYGLNGPYLGLQYVGNA